MARINQKTKSILRELTTYRVSESDVLNGFDSRAMHIIESAISLISDMEEELDQDEVDLLVKRFYSSIRNSDSNRFNRAIQKIKKDRENKE